MSIQRQSEILQSVAQVAFMASSGDYDKLVIEVEVNVEEGWVENTCRQHLDGEVTSLSLFDINEPDLADLSFELHKLMKEHTGGDLHKYSVTIDGDGTAKANFEYRNENSA